MTDRRFDGERRTGERITALETNDEAQDRTLATLSPLAVHMAEISVNSASIQKSVERIEGNVNDLHPRIRKLEYAVLLLSAVAVSPKLGGPSLPAVATAVLHAIS